MSLFAGYVGREVIGAWAWILGGTILVAYGMRNLRALKVGLEGMRLQQRLLSCSVPVVVEMDTQSVFELLTRDLDRVGWLVKDADDKWVLIEDCDVARLLPAQGKDGPGKVRLTAAVQEDGRIVGLAVDWQASKQGSIGLVLEDGIAYEATGGLPHLPRVGGAEASEVDEFLLREVRRGSETVWQARKGSGAWIVAALDCAPRFTVMPVSPQ